MNIRERLTAADLSPLTTSFSYDARSATRQLSKLDGFLTAIAVGPDAVEPRKWLGIGALGIREAALPDAIQGRAFEDALVARHDEILRQIAVEAFEPIFWEDGNGTIVADDWANGFLEALGVRLGAWESFIRSEGGTIVMVPIMALAAGSQGASRLGISQEGLDEMRQMAPGLIPISVLAMDAFWRSRKSRGISVEPLRVAKVGRNEPCPCGSAKKFKKCCGGNP